MKSVTQTATEGTNVAQCRAGEAGAPNLSAPDLAAGYALDLDGTVYLGDAALPGAVEAIAALRAAGGRVLFVTNKPLETSVDYAAKLTGLGVPAGLEDVVTAVDSVLDYLANTHPDERVLAVAEPATVAILIAAGVKVTEDPASAQVVLVAFDRTFDYAKLTAAYRAVRFHGAAIVATNPDPYCPTPDGGIPDCAAMLAAVEACTGTRAEAVGGKPGRYMADAVLARLALPAADVVMVGDRLATDVAMAQRAAMVDVLTMSGATSAAELSASAIRPTYVIAGLSDLIP